MMISDFWAFTLNCLEKLASPKTYTFKPFHAFLSRLYGDVTTLIIFLSPGLLGSEVGFDCGSLEIILLCFLTLFISWCVLDKVLVSFLNINLLNPFKTTFLTQSTKDKNVEVTIPVEVNDEEGNWRKVAVSNYLPFEVYNEKEN